MITKDLFDEQGKRANQLIITLGGQDVAIIRKLEIAGMKGTFKLRFRDIANSDMVFRSICGGSISVSRSQNGTTYIVTCDTDHFRVYADIVGPSDLPNLFYWDDCTAYGWWRLDGFAQTDFAGGNFPVGVATSTAQEMAQADLGKPKEVNLW